MQHFLSNVRISVDPTKKLNWITGKMAMECISLATVISTLDHLKMVGCTAMAPTLGPVAGNTYFNFHFSFLSKAVYFDNIFSWLWKQRLHWWTCSRRSNRLWKNYIPRRVWVRWLVERWPAYGVRYNHTCYHHVGNDYDDDCFINYNYVNDNYVN